MNKQLEEDFLKIQRIKSGIDPLDEILNGGFTPGKIIQLLGETQTGKTTLALQIAYNFCFNNRKVVYIDTKGDIVLEHIQKMRLTDYYDEAFIYKNSSTFKETEEFLDIIIKKNKPDLIIIDSLPSLINERCLMLDGKNKIDSSNTNTNSNTRPLIFLINKLKKVAKAYNINLLFINEFRNKISLTTGTINKPFGPKMLESESNVIIQVKKASTKNKKFKDLFKPMEDKLIGISMEMTTLKNNIVITPLKPIPYFYEFGKGFNIIYTKIFLLIQDGKIIKNGDIFKCGNITATGILQLVTELTNYINPNSNKGGGV